MFTVSLIVAIDSKNGISKDGQIPWHIKEDICLFKEVTSSSNLDHIDSAIIMGRKTYESIGHPLKNRVNIVITKNTDLYNQETFTFGNKSLVSFSDLYEAVQYCRIHKLRTFICGGRDIYESFLNNTLNRADRQEIYISDLHITYINQDFNCNLCINADLSETKLLADSYYIHEKKNLIDDVVYIHYHKNYYEYKYNQLVNSVLLYGTLRSNRTEIPAISDFGKHLEFSLLDNVLPLLTSKKTSFKIILNELLWFISGSTDTNILLKQGIKIWQGNSSLAFLRKMGLPYEEGDIGPSYGFQWRHAGAEYTSCHADYTCKGVDQIQNLIDGLKSCPFGRRHILSAWNVAQLDKMALPPCHLLLQLYVSEIDNKKYLSGQLYQRSADAFLGVPFNIASYATLIMLIAQEVNMLPDRLLITFGDFHIYENHICQVKEQLKRTPYKFPILKIRPGTSVFTAKLEDFELLNYQSHGVLKADMAV